MLKINLSDDASNKKKPDMPDNTVLPSDVAEPSEKASAKKIKLSSEGPAFPKKTNKVLLAVLVIILLAAAGYYQKDLILKYLPDLPNFQKNSKKASEKTVAAPPAKPERIKVISLAAVAVKDSTYKAYDLTFDSFEKIVAMMPEMVWFSSFEISYDGSYTVGALSFDYPSIKSFTGQLANFGKLTSKNIPPVSKSAEETYNFKISGKIAYIDIPDILDEVSSDSLAAYSAIIFASCKDKGVKAVRLPKAGLAYKEGDMPFALEGEIGNIKSVINKMLAGRTNLKLYKFSMTGLPGVPYDKVRASFSVRSVPAL